MDSHCPIAIAIRHLLHQYHEQFFRPSLCHAQLEPCSTDSVSTNRSYLPKEVMLDGDLVFCAIESSAKILSGALGRRCGQHHKKRSADLAFKRFDTICITRSTSGSLSMSTSTNTRTMRSNHFGLQCLWLSCLLLFVNATNNVCSQGIYQVLSPLKSNPAAQKFCAANYPIPAVTTTVAQKKNQRRTATSSTVTTSNSSAKKDALMSSLVVQARNVVSTLCSCIGTTSTVTVGQLKLWQNLSDKA